EKGRPRPVQNIDEQVTAVGVGAEPEVRVGAFRQTELVQLLVDEDLVRVVVDDVVREQRRGQREQDEEADEDGAADRELVPAEAAPEEFRWAPSDDGALALGSDLVLG